MNPMNPDQAAVTMIQETVCTYSEGRTYRWNRGCFERCSDEYGWQACGGLPIGVTYEVVPDPSLPFPEPEPKVVDVECRVERGEWVYNDHDGLSALITNAPADTRFVKFAWDLPDGYVFTADHYAPLWWDESEESEVVYHGWQPPLKLLTPHLHMLSEDPEIVGGK